MSEETFSEEKRKARKKVTIESHMEKYQLLISMINEEIERKQKAKESGIRSLQSFKKIVKELEGEVPKITKIKKNTSVRKVSGFSFQYKITEELAKFMKIPKETTPTRNDITNAICVYCHIKPNETKEQILKWKNLNPDGKRNLQDPKNKKNIIPDDTLKKLLNYDDYVKKVKKGEVYRNEINKDTKKKEKILVTDASLSYSIIQKLIQPQILEIKRVKKEDDFEIVN